MLNGRLQVRLTERELGRLDDLAENQGVTRSALVRPVIQKWLDSCNQSTHTEELIANEDRGGTGHD